MRRTVQKFSGSGMPEPIAFPYSYFVRESRSSGSAGNEKRRICVKCML